MLQAKSHVFFDLDHTLWDYNRNCEEALNEIFILFDIESRGIKTLQLFINQFHIENNRLWNLYDCRQITATQLRHHRFRDVFSAFGIQNQTICDKIHQSYMELSPNKPYLMEGAIEILDYLLPKYKLSIITNGIADNQATKMKASGIEKYFENVICSQKANARKPEKAIFEFALNITNCTASQAVMIGDNYEVDIIGAENIGIDAIFYAPDEKSKKNTYKNTIEQLSQLKKFL